MKLSQRIRSVIFAVLMILICIAMIAVPEAGFSIVIAILCIALIVSGIQRLVYYGTMARFMVGGRRILYTGLLLLDAGLFTFTLSNIPQIYVMMYLAAVNGLAGGISVMRALEDRRQGAAHWRMRLFFGAVTLAFAAACGIFVRSINLAVFIYCAGLLYSAAMRIISAFRRTEIVYIA